jgi:hypothetical protein
MIDGTVIQHLPKIRFTYRPRYNPFLDKSELPNMDLEVNLGASPSSSHAKSMD